MTVRLFFRLGAWLLVASIVLATLTPLEQRPVTAAPADLERFIAFAAVGGAFALGYPKRRFGAVILVLLIIGVLEGAQHLVPDRHGLLHDAFMKAAGACLGAAIAILTDLRFKFA